MSHARWHRGVLRIQQQRDPGTRDIRCGVFVVARGPGQLSVGESGEEILRVSPQRLVWPARSVAADREARRVLDRALLLLPKGGALCSQESVVLLRLGRALLSHGHGGALFVVASDDQIDDLTVKYAISSDGSTYLSGVLPDESDEENAPSDEPMSRFSWQMTEYADDRLPEAIAAVARLSAVDGGVLVGADLSLRGFGTFVSMPTSNQEVTEYRITHEGGLKSEGVLTADKIGGARHRSALAFVAATDGGRAAFVASQDGSLTLFVRCEGGTLAMVRAIGPAALTR